MNAKELYDLQLKTIEEIKLSGRKPTLLLHSCCGPCNTYPMEYLSQFFQLTLFFNNHNIYPYDEYKRRFDELLNYVKVFEKKENIKIDVILPPDYLNASFSEKLRPFANDKEGGTRCNMCFALRLSESMKYAFKNDFEYIATVMSVSRHKDALAIHDIASRQVLKYPTLKYLPSNFKKGNGYNRGIEISKEHNMYRQDYCGCQFSQSCGKESIQCG
jgi:epoxyqueuosine reductase